MAVNLRRKILDSLLVVAAALLVGPDFASAHGNLTMDQDKCVLRVGQQVIHFAGYQPELARTTEFCEDIPSVGKTIVVLDFVDHQLRELPVEVRVIPAAGTDGEWERDPVLHVPAHKYPSGTITFSKTFHEPGDFVGLVAVGTDRSAVARFPFSVGRPGQSLWHHVLLGILATLICVAFFIFGEKRRQKVLSQRGL